MNSTPNQNVATPLLGPSNADNINAFLLAIRWAESHPKEPNALNYRTMYGGSTFTDMRDHPRKVNTRWGKSSTAAGAYMVTVETYDEFRKKLGLKDFSAKSQDAIAVGIIRQAHALDLINQGKFADAVVKLRSRWSSLPGGKQTKISMQQFLDQVDSYLPKKENTQVPKKLMP